MTLAQQPRRGRDRLRRAGETWTRARVAAWASASYW